MTPDDTPQDVRSEGGPAENVIVPVPSPRANGISKADAKSQRLFRDVYAEKQRSVASLMPAGSFPEVEIRYKNLSYVLDLPKATVDRSITTVFGAFINLLKTPITLARKLQSRLAGNAVSNTTPFVVLDNVSGVLKPGTVSLLLTPPGHGKTSYLRALSGRIPWDKLKGDVTYSGLTPKQTDARGIYLKQLVQYVDQLDVHLPQLTVRETLDFANYNGTVDPSILKHPELTKAASERVDDILKLLSLETCANTVCGDDLLRGISGGEKKRVTIGECMVTNARVLLMDEISTGLDSAVTFDIVSAIRSWAIATRGTVVIALLQPTPEVYNLFDDVIMLREGAVLYHGARTALPAYLSAQGYFPPQSNVGSTSASGAKVDMADWLVEFLTHPSHAWKHSYEAAVKAGRASAGVDHSNVPVTTAQLKAAWEASQQKQQIDTALTAPTKPFELTSEFARAQYCSPYPRTAWQHYLSLLSRQWKLVSRNSLFISFRVFSAIFMAIILGTLFFQIPTANGADKFGMFLFGALHVAFSNFSELPIAVVNKYICYKHVSAGMYPSLAYVLAGSLIHVPIAAAESLVFSVILYFLCGLVAEAGRFFFFFFTLFLVDLAMAALFRIFAYGFPNMETAQVAPGPLISIQMLFAGFLITREKMGWLLFMHYISLFGYALRSLAQNEFLSEPYSTRDTPTGPTQGETFLQFFDFQTDPAWKWGGVGFIAGFAIICNIISGITLGNVRIERNIGTSRGKEADDMTAIAVDTSDDVDDGEEQAPTQQPGMPPLSPGGANVDEVNTPPVAPDQIVTTGASSPSVPRTPSSNPASATRSVLPFEPMTVVFQDIWYTVPIPAKVTGSRWKGDRVVVPASEKVLLQGVTGYAAPYSLTALMGASGAGKTTLLDVIAGRKNSGKMKGTVMLNGFPKEQKSFARLTAYVEQMDIHSPLATVRESLQFSADLRLPSSVPAATRKAFVEEILALLELHDIADRKVGDVGAADGLSPGQRKRLTIGVELVSNAPIIFLDEPTTGLDSRAAAVVIRVIKKIAESGRTVITTIHQPSADLFFNMDNLLLLQRGGHQVYMGPIGERGSGLVKYLEAIPGTPRCPRKMNPASWMLDVLAGTDSSGTGTTAGDDEILRQPSSGSVARQTSDASVASASINRGVSAAAQHSTPIPEGAIDPTRAPPSAASPGPVDYQRILHASKLWQTVSDKVQAYGTPKTGAAPVQFDSLYARGFWFQYTTVLRRLNRSYYRHVDYNFVRIMTLVGLLIMFGVIYYKLEADTMGGVQSLVSVMFMTTAFIGLLNMNVALPVLMKERAVFYRERFSYLYGPTPYGLASITIELPWLLLLTLSTVSIIYFMVGFNPEASAFFFYCLVVWVFTITFISLGQFAAAFFPGIDVAQAVVGLVIPVLFLFGGLFLREPSIPVGWKWLHIIDPIKYALEALVMPQFYCEGAGCPLVQIQTLSGTSYVDRYQYVQTQFGLDYSRRWHDIGYLVIFIAVFQVLHFLSLRFISHIKR